MIDPGLINRIAFAKYLFWQGNENLKKNTALSDGIAVLNFQDSAEMILRTIAELVHASIKEQASFDVIIIQIENSQYNDKNYKIPFRSSLNQLNKARVNFKHFGLLPKNEDVQKFSRDLELLFTELILKFFKLSFDSISLIDLIKYYRVKNHLKISEKELSSNNFENSIIASAKAFRLLFGNSRDLDLGIGSFPSFGRDDLNHAFTNIKEKLEEHELELDILKYGINLSEYHLFKNIVPIVHLSMANTFHVVIQGDFKEQCNPENAQFCLRFVVDSALLIQNSPIIKDKYRRVKSKYKVIIDSDIIVYPKTDELEIIRLAKKGEILDGHYLNKDFGDYCAVYQDNDRAYIKKDDVKLIDGTTNT